jgi:hypothetical protein
VAAFATVDDYEARAAVTLADPQLSQVTAYLTDASALMTRAIPAGFTPDPDTARAVCVSIVRRVMANPGGFRVRTIGGYSETLGEDGGMYLTDAEAALLQPTDPTDPDADAAYSVSLAEESVHRWIPAHRWLPGVW